MKLWALIAVIDFIFLSKAVPFQSTRNVSHHRDATAIGISQTLLNNFRIFANYTAASYCPNNENSTAGSQVTCPNHICSLVEADNVASIASFGNLNDTSLTDLKGFVALDPVRSLVVVAFGGSGATIRNWLTDFTFLLIPSTIPGCLNCWVHAGFAKGWAERRSVVLGAVASALSSHGNYSLILTGHSIGGAVATIAAAELRHMGYVMDLYTYGSPRAGNNAFATFVTGQAPELGWNYRMTHVNDPVPQLPPTWIGYKHISPEYWLANGTATTDDYEAEDVVVCSVVSNEECNAGTGLVPIEGDAHNHYLGDIGACQGPLSW